MAYQTLLVDVKDQVATITLNRPDAYNALNLQLASEFFHAALEADEDRAVRCIAVTGAGKAFCAGGGGEDFADTPPTVGALIKQLPTSPHGAVSRLCRSPKPV